MAAATPNPEKDTVSVTVQLPADVARGYGATPQQIGRHLLEQAAVEGYRSRELSRGQVARMLQLDREGTEELLAKHLRDRHDDLEEVEQARKDLGKIFGLA